MKVTNPTEIQGKVRRALQQQKAQTSPGGEWVNPTARVREGTTEYVLSYHRDGKWRVGFVSTYGNTQGLHGSGCDASGLVITDIELMGALDGLFVE